MDDMLFAAERHGIPVEEIIMNDERDPNYYIRQDILRTKKEDIDKKLNK
jgi:hypothetical protein